MPVLWSGGRQWGSCSPGPDDMGQGQSSNRNGRLAPGEGKDPWESQPIDIRCKAKQCSVKGFVSTQAAVRFCAKSPGLGKVSPDSLVPLFTWETWHV